MSKNGFSGFSRENRPTIDDAMKRAARDALLAHKRAGVPIAVWRDGKVVTIPAEEIEIPPLEDATSVKDGDADSPRRDD
jgi:hypothetical protein